MPYISDVTFVHAPPEQATAYTGPGRDCAAVKYTATAMWLDQCARRATKLRDGYAVCGTHARQGSLAVSKAERVNEEEL